MIKLKCDNEFFQKKGICSLEKVELDYNGMCNNCKQVYITSDELIEKKQV